MQSLALQVQIVAEEKTSININMKKRACDFVEDLKKHLNFSKRNTDDFVWDFTFSGKYIVWFL